MNFPDHPKLVYLAGPYRSKLGEYGVHQNIEEASRIAYELWRLGLAAICPHKNTAFFGSTDIPEMVWLTGDFVMVERSDAIVMMPNWRSSQGAVMEHAHALSKGMEIFYWDLEADRARLSLWALETEVKS